MSVRVDITATDKASPVLQRLANDRGMRGLLAVNTMRGLARAGQALVGSAVRHRFTGKGPFPAAQNKLGVVTGRLRRSIRATLPGFDAATGEIRMEFGSNVSYFAAHEFGFQGKVQVRGHARRLIGTGTLTAGGKRAGKFTKKSQRELVARRRGRVKTIAQVRPHSRRMNIPARAPLGTELKSERGRTQIVRALREGLQRTMREVNP